MRAYIAHAMTGRTGEEVVSESLHISEVCKKYDIEPLDPVIAEGVKKADPRVQSTNEMLPRLWKRDKEMIREAHVLIDVTADRKSEGVQHEIGYARCYLWKPVIRVSINYARNPNISIANLEDDLIVGSIEQAAYFAQLRWGTFRKRLCWRLTLLNRCLLKFLWHQLGEIK